jgi:hypothetical protein
MNNEQEPVLIIKTHKKQDFERDYIFLKLLPDNFIFRRIAWAFC